MVGGGGVGGGVGGGGIPSDYLVSTQLQLLLFCCWGCGCCCAVTIKIFLVACYHEKSRICEIYIFPMKVKSVNFVMYLVVTFLTS